MSATIPSEYGLPSGGQRQTWASKAEEGAIIKVTADFRFISQGRSETKSASCVSRRGGGVGL